MYDFSLDHTTDDSGDFGGDITCMPPIENLPLGAVVLGDTSSKAMQTFFAAQALQPVLLLPTKWLEVGHVDEILQFLPSPPGTIICTVASPADAENRINKGADGAGYWFFADGRNEKTNHWGVTASGYGARFPSAGQMTATSGIVDPAKVHSWPVTPDDLWVCFTTGLSKGLTLHITGISTPPFPGPIYFTIDTANAYMAATAVMNDTENVDKNFHPAKPLNLFANYTQIALQPLSSADLASCLHAVAPADKFVVLDGMKFWWFNADMTNPIMSVSGVSFAELLADQNLTAFNSLAQASINVAASEIALYMRGFLSSYLFVPITAPTLFEGRMSGTNWDARSGVALTPGIANLQIVGSTAFASDPMAYHLFTDNLAIPNLKLVDDWDLYHSFEGEVHCGTNVRRTGTPPVSWWTLGEY